MPVMCIHSCTIKVLQHSRVTAGIGGSEDTIYFKVPESGEHYCHLLGLVTDVDVKKVRFDLPFCALQQI